MSRFKSGTPGSAEAHAVLSDVADALASRGWELNSEEETVALIGLVIGAAGHQPLNDLPNGDPK